MSFNPQKAEQFKLTPLSDRYALFYVERTRLQRAGDAIRLVGANRQSFELPVASIGGLLMGPGCSITTEAARICNQRGCLIAVTGGGGIPVWSVSTRYRSPKNKISQFSLSCDPVTRVALAKKLFAKRQDVINRYAKNEGVPPFNPAEGLDSIQKMLGFEGAWAKEAYKLMGIAEHISTQNVRVRDQTPLALLNFFLYSVTSLVIEFLGYDQNLGILHGQSRGGGLVFDIADAYKPVLTLRQAFHAAARNHSSAEMKAGLLSDLLALGIVDDMIKFTKELFEREE